MEDNKTDSKTFVKINMKKKVERTRYIFFQPRFGILRVYDH